MNEFKAYGANVGYTNKVKKYGVLSEVVKVLDKVKSEFLSINNIPVMNDSELRKFQIKNDTHIAYAYHGNDTHEFAIIRDSKPIDRVFLVINCMEDEEDVYFVFTVNGSDKYNKKYCKYTKVKKSIHIEL